MKMVRLLLRSSGCSRGNNKRFQEVRGESIRRHNKYRSGCGRMMAGDQGWWRGGMLMGTYGSWSSLPILPQIETRMSSEKVQNEEGKRGDRETGLSVSVLLLLSSGRFLVLISQSLGVLSAGSWEGWCPGLWSGSLPQSSRSVSSSRVVCCHESSEWSVSICVCTEWFLCKWTPRSSSSASHRSGDSPPFTPLKTLRSQLHFLLDLLNQFIFLDYFLIIEFRECDFIVLHKNIMKE